MGKKMDAEKQKSTVKIVPYDSRAPEIFQSLKQYIGSIIPCDIEVEHIGSTAVVGLFGKGIIDILIIAKREQTPVVIEALEVNGYKRV